jgi:hypothetical protein
MRETTMANRSGLPATRKGKTSGYGTKVCMGCKRPLVSIPGEMVCRNQDCSFYRAADANAREIESEQSA